MTEKTNEAQVIEKERKKNAKTEGRNDKKRQRKGERQLMRMPVYMSTAIIP